MTDKTTPDKPGAPDTAPPATEPAGSAAQTAASADAAAQARKAPPPKSPLITAIEIENFKGIGAPVRIDLRPITLLFGRNSAGKSTILQALCYAHEILTHRNVDARKTELGGEQIDLGGFRQFVHGQDLDREVRLRFELNLEGWSVPERLLEDMRRSREADDNDWIETDNLAEFVRSGWVKLAVARNRFGQKPELASYEVGVNETLVGRIQRDDSTHMKLTFNWEHPVFEPVGGGQPAQPRAAAVGVREATGPLDDRQQLYRATVHGRLKSPLPRWDGVLDLEVDSEDDWELGGAIGGPNHSQFNALASALLVGVGAALRDELAEIRYLGPVRELRPHTAVEQDPHEQGTWSNGSAAWNRLLSQNELEAFIDGDLFTHVNDWLALKDRLDTGYKLRPTGDRRTAGGRAAGKRDSTLRMAPLAIPQRTGLGRHGQAGPGPYNVF